MHKQPFFFQMAVKEVTTADNGEVRVRGYASTPNLDRYRDIVEPSAFEGALKTYMTNPVVLRSHDADRPVGLVESAKVTDKGLWVEAIIKEEKTAKEVNAGLFRTFSIGYIPLSTELRNKDNQPFDPMKDDPWDHMNIRVIKELDLVEISVVSTPANAGALFSLAKSLKDFTRKLAFKAFNVSMKDNIPANETEPEDAKAEEGEGEQTEEAKAATDEKKSEETKAEAGGSCTLEDGASGTWQEGEDGTLVCMPTEASADDDEEKSVDTEEAVDEEAEDVEETEQKPDEDAGAATQNEDKAEEKSTDQSQEEAENAGETPAAEGGEGGDKPAEAPSADAKPETETEEGTEDKSEKTIIVSKDVADLFPNLKAVGALREPEGEEKGIEVPKAWIGLMRKLHDALVSENERANTEQKAKDALQKVLDTTPAKKAIAVHAQFGGAAEDTQKGAETETKEPSAFFKSLFNLK